MDYEDREAKALEILNAPEAAAAVPPAAPGGATPGADGGAAGAVGGAPPAAGAGGVPGIPGGPGGVGGAAQGQPPAAGAPAAGAPGQPPAVAPGQPPAGVQPGVPAAAVPLWTGAQPVPVDELQQLMGTHNIGGMDQLKGTLADADALYQVLDGRQTGASLLEAVRLNYPPQTFFRILGEVQNYLQRFNPGGGFGSAPYVPPSGLAVPPGFPTLPAPIGTPPGAPAAGGAPGNGNGAGAADNGLALRLTQLENTWQAQQRQAQMQAEEQGRQAGFQKFMGRIRELGTKEGLDEDDIGNYAAAVAQRINGDVQITGRLLQGKLNDIDRLFTEHHNSMLQWENRRNQRRLQQKQEKNDVQPRIATGGGPPAPVKPGKQDMSFEGRTARAMEILKQ